MTGDFLLKRSRVFVALGHAFRINPSPVPRGEREPQARVRFLFFVPEPLCEQCGEHPGRVRVTRIVGSRETTLHLCPICARANAAQLFGSPLGDLVCDFDLDASFAFEVSPDEDELELDNTIAGAPLEALMNACFFEKTDSDEDDPFSDGDDENLFQTLNADEEEADAVCSGCGATWPQIARDERAGCSRCYSTFRVSLSLLLEQVQRTPRHAGKEPRAALKRRLRLEHLRQRRDHQLTMLQSRLAQAVKSERYEEAALLRDKIKVVSSSLF